MNEVKTPKKPLIYYYVVTILAIFFFNTLLLPFIAQRSVKEVDYGTFMTMTYDQQIEYVQIQENQIVFTEKDSKQVYKTGIVYDPEMTQRLYDNGAQFKQKIVEEMSPLMGIFLTWILPMLIFVGIGQLLSGHLTKKMGGHNAMSFGMGKSNAKIYVPSMDGIKFTDVAGEDEAKENLTEIVDYLHNPSK